MYEETFLTGSNLLSKNSFYFIKHCNDFVFIAIVTLCFFLTKMIKSILVFDTFCGLVVKLKK